MNVACDLCWGGRGSAKHCVFLCEIVAASDEGQLVCPAGTDSSFWHVIGSLGMSWNAWFVVCAEVNGVLDARLQIAVEFSACLLSCFVAVLVDTCGFAT